MTPHEETWVTTSPGRVRVDATSDLVGDFADAERERLATAAPDMARALLGLLERPDGCPMCDEGVLRKGSDKHWPECPYPTARAALTKAGVPCP